MSCLEQAQLCEAIAVASERMQSIQAAFYSAKKRRRNATKLLTPLREARTVGRSALAALELHEQEHGCSVILSDAHGTYEKVTVCVGGEL
jgi:hypothetical protein